MYQGQMVFSQVMDILPWRRFLTCVNRYHGDTKAHALTTQEFFKIMVFAQLTGRESLSETVLCLNAVPAHLVSKGKMHDVRAMDVIDWEAGSWYAMDRAYLDFARLYRIHQCGAYFVTRSKKNTKYERVYSHPVDKSTGVLCDQRVRLTGTNADIR